MMVYQIVREELGPFNMLVLCIRRMLEPSVLACYWVNLFSTQVARDNIVQFGQILEVLFRCGVIGWSWWRRSTSSMAEAMS